MTDLTWLILSTGCHGDERVTLAREPGEESYYRNLIKIKENKAS